MFYKKTTTLPDSAAGKKKHNTPVVTESQWLLRPNALRTQKVHSPEKGEPFKRLVVGKTCFFPLLLFFLWCFGWFLARTGAVLVVLIVFVVRFLLAFVFIAAVVLILLHVVIDLIVFLVLLLLFFFFRLSMLCCWCCYSISIPIFFLYHFLVVVVAAVVRLHVIALFMIIAVPVAATVSPKQQRLKWVERRNEHKGHWSLIVSASLKKHNHSKHKKKKNINKKLSTPMFLLLFLTKKPSPQTLILPFRSLIFVLFFKGAYL